MRVLSGQVIGADTREVRMRMLDGRNVEVITSAAPLWDRVGILWGCRYLARPDGAEAVGAGTGGGARRELGGTASH